MTCREELGASGVLQRRRSDVGRRVENGEGGDERYLRSLALMGGKAKKGVSTPKDVRSTDGDNDGRHAARRRQG